MRLFFKALLFFSFFFKSIFGFSYQKDISYKRSCVWDSPVSGLYFCGKAHFFWGNYELYHSVYHKGKTLSDHAPVSYGRSLSWNVLGPMRNSEGGFYTGCFENTPYPGTPNEKIEDYEERFKSEIEYLLDQKDFYDVIFLQEVFDPMIEKLKKKFLVIHSPQVRSKKVLLFKKDRDIHLCEPQSCFSNEQSAYSEANALIAYDDHHVYVSFHARPTKGSRSHHIPNREYTLKLLQRIYEEPLFKGKTVLAGGDFNTPLETLYAWSLDPKKNYRYPNAKNWEFITKSENQKKAIDGFISFTIEK